MIFHLHHCPAARKRASAVFIECIRIFWIVILDSLPSMLEAKAFLRDTSTGIAGGFRSQQKEPILFPGKALFLLPYREILLFILSKPKTFARSILFNRQKRALSMRAVIP